MTRTTCRLLGTLVLLLGLAGTARAQVTAADYDRAMGLRERWMYLTDERRRPGDVGRRHHPLLLPQDGEGRLPVRDGRRAVAAASAGVRSRQARGCARRRHRREVHRPAPAVRHLPVLERRARDGDHVQRIGVDVPAARVHLRAQRVRAEADAAVSRGASAPIGTRRSHRTTGQGRRRTGGGRRSSATTTSSSAPRQQAGKAVKALSSDGAEGNAYDPESIVWSPDSTKIAAYRVRPGFRRIVYRVESSPADQVQPKLHDAAIRQAGRRRRSRSAAPSSTSTRAKQLSDRERSLPESVRDVAARVAAGQPDRQPSSTRSAATRRFASSRSSATSGAARAVDLRGAEDVLQQLAQVQPRRRGTPASEILWMSERDGWNHLYLYDGATGKVKNQITRGRLGRARRRRRSTKRSGRSGSAPAACIPARTRTSCTSTASTSTVRTW